MPAPFTCRLCCRTVAACLPLGEAPWRVLVHLMMDHLSTVPHRHDTMGEIPDSETLLEGLLARVYDPPVGFNVKRGIAAN